MADRAEHPGKEVEGGGGGGAGSEQAAGGGAAGGGAAGGGAAALTEAQRLVLERCIRALKEARKDSQTLAALLLITRLCPARHLDKDSLRRIFEAVGMGLPARLLVTAYRRSDESGLSPLDVLSLGTALLAALSTHPDMVAHPQLLATVPVLLGLVANGPGDAAVLDRAVAADCYQVLTAVGALPRGPDHLLRRGAVPALCRAAQQKQTLSREEGLPLLAGVVSGRTRDRAWQRHSDELLCLLLALCANFSQAPPDARLDMCSLLVRFLPPAAVESPELREAVVGVWGALRPMVQSRLPAERLGAVLVLAACLLDLFGWEPAGPPNFCCLLVHRACVEVRMGLEGPPGTRIGSQLQHTLAGCYRIMEAAFEQACCQRDAEPDASAPSLSLQQSRQVFKVLEEGFSAIVFHLQQIESGSFGHPFVLASYRCVCVWLAEETSCLKEEVTALLPFLLAFSRRHLQGPSSSSSPPPLGDCMELLSMDEAEESWSGPEALRYLLPALCHLSAEEGPRKALLALDAPALLVDFLLLSCSSLEGPRTQRSPSMEALCSALLNFTVTEPERVRTDPCFRVLEAHVCDTLPLLVTKPILLVLAANYCTLGLLMGSLGTPSAGPVEAGQRRLVSTALRFLRTALDGSGAPGPVRPSASWKDVWYEVEELWRLGLRALAGWLRAQPGLAATLREEGWLRHVLDLLLRCGAMQDPQSQDDLEEALCAAAGVCTACREELDQALKEGTGVLSSMDRLRKTLG